MSFSVVKVKEKSEKNIKRGPDLSNISGAVRQSFTKKRRTCSASITIEAALVLPMAMFAVYILLMPLKAIEAERILHNRMESAAKDLALAAYIEKVGEDVFNSSVEDDTRQLLSSVSEETALISVMSNADESVMKNIHLSDFTSILSGSDGCDPSMINMKLIYELRLPHNIFKIIPVEKELVVSRRAWIGASGGRGRVKYGSEEDQALSKTDEENEDRIVYVGKNSTRYHLDPNCHYLSNNMASTAALEIESLRNSSGGKYHACPCCNPGSTGTVYYFKNGTAYHSDPNCKAITAYAREAKLSEVEHMGACSYCGGKCKE